MKKYAIRVRGAEHDVGDNEVPNES